MICPFCGFEGTDDYCHYCGNNVSFLKRRLQPFDTRFCSLSDKEDYIPDAGLHELPSWLSESINNTLIGERTDKHESQ